MAPAAKLSYLPGSDFILTLSDHDEASNGSREVSVIASDEDVAEGNIRKRKSKRHHVASGPIIKKAKSIDPLASGNRIEPKGKGLHQSIENSALTDGEDDGALNSDFEFAQDGVDAGILHDFDGWEQNGLRQNGSNAPSKTRIVTIDDIIERRRVKPSEEQDRSSEETDIDNPPTAHLDDVDGQAEPAALAGSRLDEDELLADDAFGMGVSSRDDLADHGAQSMDDDDGGDPDASDHRSDASPAPHPDDVDSAVSSDHEKDHETPAEAARREAFFAPEEPAPDKTQRVDGKGSTSFQSMSLSRPVLKGLASVGFAEPTPIQSKTIPMALLGKDVVGGAVTGSGKTAAFLVPILERLLYRPRRIITSRVAILMPTRELAVQCHNVAKRLAAFTDITFCRLVGGFSLREQENELKRRPDVIIATPGRFIDHMRNSASFTVDTLEILVLDEADRMLEDGFADELNEILTTIPKSRQTMLFSATMTESVDQLIRVGLNRPVRLMLDTRTKTVGTLVQEFVRLRPGREDKRLGYLAFLCSSIYTDRVIIFFRQKKETHRVRIIFGLLGIKASELHGSMSQEQRIQSVEAFRGGKVSFLLATDLASRGLDIKGVETVINYEAPQSYDIYLHRVGRTARAGRSGRSCTLAAENDRKVIKTVVRTGKSQGAKIVSRVVDPGTADDWASKVDALEDEVEAILREEKEERQLAQAEIHVTRGENLIAHEDEIKSRPKRTWFESESAKRAAHNRGQVDLNGPQTVKAKADAKKKRSRKDQKKAEIHDQIREGPLWKKRKADVAKTGAGLKKQKEEKKKKEKKKKKKTGPPTVKAPSEK